MEQKYTREKLLTTPAELQKKLGSSVLCLIDTRPAEDYAVALAAAGFRIRDFLVKQIGKMASVSRIVIERRASSSFGEPSSFLPA